MPLSTENAVHQTLGIGARLDGVEELHVCDIVDIDLVLYDDNEPPPVKLHGKYRGGKRELADGRLSLWESSQYMSWP
jgi:uncharacterized membrane protein